MVRTAGNTQRGRRGPLVAAFAAGALILAGCSSQAAGEGAGQSGAPADEVPVVAVASYPLAFLAKAVGGDQVIVEDVSTKGDAHHLELTPAQVQAVGKADLAVHLSGGFQPAIDDAIRVTGVRSLDAMDAVPTGQQIAGDPHIWLNPLLAADVADALAAQLSELDPGEANYYESNAASLREKLEETDREYAEVLAKCQGETMLTSHEAFGYMAARYDMEQVGVLGVDPDAEPSPARVGEVLQIIGDRGISTLFVEPSGTHAHDADEDHEDEGHHHSHENQTKLAQTLGVRGVELDPLETQIDAERDFLAVLHSNLHALSEGLSCAAPLGDH